MGAPSVTQRIEQGYNIKAADNAAISAGSAWKLLPGLRAEHNTVHNLLKEREATAQAYKDKYAIAVDRKNIAEDRADEAYQNFSAYIIAKYSEAKANEMLVALNIDVPIEEADDAAVARLYELMNRWIAYDGTPDQIPTEYKSEIIAATNGFASLVLEVQSKETAMDQAFSERDQALQKYVGLMKRIRKWLVSKLPDGRYDARLKQYGFTPYEKPSYPIPNIVEGLVCKWVPEASRVELNWLQTADCASYEVWRAPKPDDPNKKPVFKFHATTENIFYYDSDVAAGMTYIYKVRGMNRWHEGDFSKEVEVGC